MNHAYKVLQVTAADVTVKKLLLPLIDRLNAEGYQVHIACSEGDGVSELRAKGHIVHTINIERRISPISNLKSLWRLYRLMKEEPFDIVHVHTPVAAALGRIAAWAARVPVVIYTAHGFYFHDHMSGWVRRLVMWLEKLLCRFTHLVFIQSHEDVMTAVNENICPAEKVTWIGNGVDLERFAFKPERNGIRANLGLSARDKVIGFVGRIVAEKGVLELVEAMRPVIKTFPEAKLLLVGDTLQSDRDRKTKQAIRSLLAENGLASHVVFTGFVDDIPGIMKAIDLFVLPSYREGMPRSIIEAMASGKPVVSTDIRGCREEVVPGLTGLLVPVKDPAALAIAIISLLSDPELARRMGVEGRRRACELYDERIILNKQIKAYAEISRRRLDTRSSLKKAIPRKRIQLWFKRAADVAVSFLSLTLLCLPFLGIAALIKINSPGPIFFRQERIGRYGKPFRVWKFRTMVVGAIDQGLGVNFAENDPRITKVGKVIRGWGLDELPQLINVLTGEMSLVGPRPTLGYQVEQYNDFQVQRLAARPGVTSLAVVNGRNLLPWSQRIKLDVWYIDNWSLWLDLKTIFKTFWAVLVSREGVYGPGGMNDGDFALFKAPDPAQRDLKLESKR